MTDQKAGVDIENVDRYARMDIKRESDGNLDMDLNPSGTSKCTYEEYHNWFYFFFLAFTAPGVEVRFVL